MNGSLKSREFTPHVHKDWHRHGYIPEISPHLDSFRQRERAEAIVIAEILGMIERHTKYDQTVAEFSTRRMIGVASAAKELTQSHEFFEIAKAFERAPDVVNLTRECWRQFKSSPVTDSPSPFERSEPILEICLISENRMDGEKRDLMMRRLVEAWCAVVENFVDSRHQELDRPGRRIKAEELTGTIRDTVMDRLKTRGIREETFVRIRDNFDATRKKFLTDLG